MSREPTERDKKQIQEALEQLHGKPAPHVNANTCPVCDAERWKLTQRQLFAFGLGLGEAVGTHRVAKLFCATHKTEFETACREIERTVTESQKP